METREQPPNRETLSAWRQDVSTTFQQCLRELHSIRDGLSAMPAATRPVPSTTIERETFAPVQPSITQPDPEPLVASSDEAGFDARLANLKRLLAEKLDTQ